MYNLAVFSLAAYSSCTTLQAHHFHLQGLLLHHLHRLHSTLSSSWSALGFRSHPEVSKSKYITSTSVFQIKSYDVIKWFTTTGCHVYELWTLNKTGDLDLGIALQCCVCRKVPRHGDVELKFMLIIIVKMAVDHYIDHVDHHGRDDCWSLHWSMLVKIMIMLIKITIMLIIMVEMFATFVMSKLVYAPDAKASLLNSSWCWLPRSLAQW